ncbi:MAG: hypothetical protein WCO98_06095 [bacterium]
MRTPLRALLVSGLLAASLMAFAAPVKIETAGYVQGRYESAPGVTGKQFNMTRALVASRIFATADTGIYLVACNTYKTNSPELQYAYAFLIDGTMEYRAGMSTIPFGYENPSSASRLITLERSKISSVLFNNAAVGGNAALDRGVFVNYTPKTGIGIQGAIINGTPYSKAADSNANKNVLVRAFKPVAGGELGASLYVGKSETSSLMNRAGLDLTTIRGNYTIVSEIMAGKGSVPAAGNASAYGGYVSVQRRVQGSDIAPYARLELTDQNARVDGGLYKALTLGTAYFVGPTAKISGQVIVEKNTGKTTFNQFGLQYQVIFK